MNQPSTKIPFDKPATTYAEQIEILRKRGMIIDDEVRAEFYLSHINYYRLGAYWLPFEISHNPHQFKPGTRFEDVLALYMFDREFRLLVMDALERVEVSVRAQWAYCLAHHYKPHGYLDKSLYVEPDKPNPLRRDIDKITQQRKNWCKNKDDLAKEVNRSEESFIEHLTNKHSEEFPPAWAASEIMSFGLLSRWYASLKISKTRRWIAKAYGVDDAILASWLHHLAIVRNMCAHHSRLWNRRFSNTPQIPSTKPAALAHEFQLTARKEPTHHIYNALVILLYFMDVIAPDHSWRKRLKDFLNRSAHLLPNMGFPSDWETRKIWQDRTGLGPQNEEQK